MRPRFLKTRAQAFCGIQLYAAGEAAAYSSWKYFFEHFLYLLI